MAIGKIQKPGKGFGGALGYAVEKEGARVLDSNLAADPTDVNAAAAELAHWSRTIHPDIEKPVQTLSISLPPGEHMTDDQWRAFVDDYMEGMGWGDAKKVVVLHTDTEHSHVHIVMSRVVAVEQADGTYLGKVLSNSNSFIKTEHLLDTLEQKYGLTRVREGMRQAIRERPMAALENLLEKNLKVTEAQLVRQVSRVIKDPKERAQILAKIKTDRGTIKTADGKYTTRAVVAEGRRLERNMQRLTKQRHSTRQVKPREDSRPGLALSDEQQVARRAGASGRGLENITGYAGAGKTTLLEEVRKDLESQGRRVVGCAISGKAAAGLQEGAGIESSTIARMLMDIKAKRLTLDSHTVLIVDEAGMVDRSQLDRLMQHAADAGAAVRLVGDSRQLRPVGRGGSFDLARQIAGETAVTAVIRQSDTKDKDDTVLVDRQWMRDASAKFGGGEAAQALKDYQDKGHVQWSASRGSARARIVKDYAADVAAGRNTKDMIVMAHRRDDVHALNNSIRDELKSQGKLGEETTITVKQTVKDALGNEVTTERQLALAAGDRLVALRNDKSADLKNGQFGTVVKVNGHLVTVDVDNGDKKPIRQTIDTEKYNHIAHGYAATIHKEQGDTRDKAFVLGSDTMDSHLTYVSMTRHREDVRLYANRAEFETDEDLRESLSKTPEPDVLDGETESETLEESYERDANDGNAAVRDAEARSAGAAAENGLGAGRGDGRRIVHHESGYEADLHGRRPEAATGSSKPVRSLSSGYLEIHQERLARTMHGVSQPTDATMGRAGRTAGAENPQVNGGTRSGAVGVRSAALRELRRSDGQSSIESKWRNLEMSFKNFESDRQQRAAREVPDMRRYATPGTETRAAYEAERAKVRAQPSRENSADEADSDNKGGGRERYLGEGDARNVGRNAEAFGQGFGHAKAEIGAHLQAQESLEAKTERYIDTAKPMENDDGTYRLEMQDDNGDAFVAGDEDGPYKYGTIEEAETAQAIIESEANERDGGGMEL